MYASQKATSKHIERTCHGPGFVLPHFILSAPVGGTDLNYCHFVDEETGSER